MAIASPEERVKAGAAFLDENVGPDWFERVNLDTFDLQSGCRCIAAQLVGGFEGGYSNAWEYAMIEWGIIHAPADLDIVDMDRSRDLGFLGVSDDRGPEDWFAVEREWRELIEARVTEREALPA